jgi:hypothetical protein
MYWWNHAAELISEDKARRAGLITTNSLRQTFNRRVVQAAMDQGVGLAFAIPDHPWVDSANGAAVRIAMTVAERSNQGDGRLLTVIGEQPGEHGEVSVKRAERQGLVHADLTTGANVSTVVALQANLRLSYPGVEPHGSGFIVTAEEPVALGLTTVPGLARHIRDYRNGRDLTDKPRGVKVIDLFGLRAEEVRTRFPTIYQWIFDRVLNAIKIQDQLDAKIDGSLVSRALNIGLRCRPFADIS